MSLKVKKPNEPIIVLILSLLAIIIGLNLNFVSAKYNISFFSVTLYSYKGTQIFEAVISFGLSAILAVLAILFYYTAKNQIQINVAKYTTLIGIVPGVVGTILMFIGYYHFIGQPTSTGVAPSNFQGGTLSPDVGIALSFGGLFLMAVAVYMLHNYNMTTGTKESALYPDVENIPLPDDFTLDNLKALWYCPNDHAKLESIVNRTVPNPEFRVSQDRIEDNLNNAIAMRKLAPELFPYARALAQILFKKSKRPDLELVSTSCSSCRSKYVCPKLSDWY